MEIELHLFKADPVNHGQREPAEPVGFKGRCYLFPHKDKDSGKWKLIQMVKYSQGLLVKSNRYPWVRKEKKPDYYYWVNKDNYIVYTNDPKVLTDPELDTIADKEDSKDEQQD